MRGDSTEGDRQHAEATERLQNRKVGVVSGGCAQLGRATVDIKAPAEGGRISGEGRCG
jgi:hypothetical protein